MKYLILSDIHANKEALGAILSFVRRKPWDKAVFLGDLVGYGANPNQTVDLVRSLRPLTGIRGNHDKVCSGIEDGELSEEVDQAEPQLAARPARGAGRGRRSFRDLARHPHRRGRLHLRRNRSPERVPPDRLPGLLLVIFGLSPDAITTILTVGTSFRYRLKPGVRYLINPGSIGQPRDGNPLASFAIYDSDARAVTIYRIPYRVYEAQQKILKAGLPRPLADRLAIGR
jgi:predicted phosphodiesterase